MPVKGFNDPVLPEGLREFDDADTTRQMIYDNVVNSLTKRFPLSDGKHRIELHNVRYEGDTDYSLEKQKKALISNRSLRTPVKGTWKLFDEETGALLDERDDTVMHVPYYTQRGTIINNGNEYTVVNQSRLKPGVYARTKQSGEHEAHFNVRPGTGKTFRLWMEPSTGIFRVNVGQANIPAYPFLKAMGVTDKEMAATWGDKIYEANTAKADPQAISKLYKRFAGYNYDPQAKEADQLKWLQENLPKFELDPDVVMKTMGVEDGKAVSPKLVLRSTQKLLNISRGEEEDDDREAPHFSNIMSIEDFMAERIDKDAGRTANQLLYRVRRDKNLGRVTKGALNPYVESLILGSGLAAPIEETNPFQTLEQQHRIIKLGEGGIPSAEAVVDEARDVNPGQVGFIDLVAGPESEKIGIDTRAAFRSFKGKDQQIYGEFADLKGNKFYLKPEDVTDKTIMFPGEDPSTGEVKALRRGELVTVTPDEVDYAIPSNAHMYSPALNVAPLQTSYMPTRGFYSAKYMSQYLPMVEGEAPLVQTMVPGTDKSFSEYYGRKVGTISSKVDGVVTRVSDKNITVTDKDGKKHVIETVKDFPFNRMSAISYSSVVKPGDKIEAGDMIAKSNFTDDKGNLAMGRNLRTAVIPYKGFSFEDAYVISESAAKKLATERLYGFDKEARHGTEVGRNKFISAFPKKFTKDQVGKLDENGTVKIGQTVEKGDPIILAVGPKVLSSADAQLGKLHKTLRSAFRDESVVWEHDHPGVVVDVGRTTTGVKVNVKAHSPVEVGDKLSNQAASKGVVGKVLPDDEMPRDPMTDEPYEMLLNPMVALSRVAPNQMAELQLAKIARKTGKPYILPDEPPPGGWPKFVEQELKKHGIAPDSGVFDPGTGKILPPIATGDMYISAFHHLAEKKLTGRDVGGYSADEQPGRGSKTGAKKISGFNVNALLAHGANEVIKDAMLVRGTKNEEYWNAMKLGRPLPEPDVPFIYNKFINTMKAGGINVKKEGDVLSVMPMTNKDIDELSSGEISSAAQIDSRSFEPLAGGLFDVGRTGGMQGNKWTHIQLAEPMPNPVMEESIRRVLGLKVQEYLDIVSGKQELNGLTGGEAIRQALRKIDIDQKINEFKNDAISSRGAKRDNAIKAMRYLHGAKKQGVQPSDWVIDKVPVIPPVFRPISMIGDVVRASDMNGLYRDVIETNNAIKDLRSDLPESEIADEKVQLYKSVSAAFGLSEPITPEGQSKRWKGAIRQVIGTNPKQGMFQNKVISKTVDVVGRGVITPDPNLDMDTIGIPEDKAWVLYRPFVQRRLVRRGIPPLQASEMIESRSRQAEEELDKEMESRPVIMDRAPTWHKFNLLAFYPKRVKENVLRISPLIVSGFNADFDGDAVNFHVPATDKAVKQARERMMPSNNLFKLSDLKSVMHTPGKEMVMGLYQMTREPKNQPPLRFKSVAEAKAAYRQGDISLNDPIIIDE